MLFTSLPEEIKETILARVSRWNYPKLSLVSRSFHSLLSSMDIYKTRSQIGTTETCFYVCLRSRHDRSYHGFTLQTKPKRTKTKLLNKLVPILPHSPDYLPVSCSSTIVGSEIYFIGQSFGREPSSSVRVLDCRSHTWRNAPNTKEAKQGAYAVSLDEKVYIIGGCKSDHSSHWLEVFDTKTQSWTTIPAPCDRPWNFPVVNVIQGKIHVMMMSKDYTYDPKQGTWKVVRDKSEKKPLKVWTWLQWCVVGNVICCCTDKGACMWYDTENDKYEMIKGLEQLRDHRKYGLVTRNMHQLVTYGGNLLVVWEFGLTHSKKTKIWYAEISLEKRCNGSEIWGNIEWVDVMFTLPPNSYEFKHCFNVSV